jgi:polyisoprenoid-binding protein YceI
MRLIPNFITAAMLLWPAAAAQQIAVRFDAARTEVAFTLADVLHTVHGTFRLRRGEMRFDPATGAATGELVVDAASADSGSHARDSRMHKNILESAKFPDIVFRPDRVEGKVNADGDSEVRVHGTFLIHGGIHELVMPVRVRASGGEVRVTTSFTVPYQKWGMKNPSTLLLRVSDLVQIELTAVGRMSGGV